MTVNCYDNIKLVNYDCHNIMWIFMWVLLTLKYSCNGKSSKNNFTQFNCTAVFSAKLTKQH